MIRFLLDTNVVSEPLAASPKRAVIQALDRHAQECAIGAPVLAELRFGAARLPASRRRTAIERYIDEVVLRAFPVLAYDRAAAEWHAAERARLSKAGKPVALVDGMIASIAAVNELALVTANARDFTRFRGLKTIDWSR